jgi:zinc protease
MSYKTFEKIHNCGIKSIIIPLKNTNIVSIGIFIKAGSVNETLDNNGIAHFLEHMMFKGTKNRKGNKLAEELDNVGAQYNAGTSKEYTYYYINGSYKDINLFLEIIIDLFCHPLLNQEDINKERHVIMEELEMGLDDTSNIIMQTVHEKMFNHSSLGLSIIGTKQNIMNFKRNDFINFRQNFYIPSSSTIVVAGNIDKNKVVRKINKEFNKTDFSYYVNNMSPIIKCNAYQKVPYVYLKEKKDINQTQVVFAFRSVGSYHHNCTALDLISDVLSTGFSSRLFHTLRIKMGITYFNFSYHLGYEHEGAFIIHLGVNNSKVVIAVKAILSELLKLRQKGITEKELAKVKKINDTSMKLALKEPSEYMIFYGINSLFEEADVNEEKNTEQEFEHNPAKKRYNDLDRIKLSDIKNVIRETFIERNLNLFVYGSTKEVHKNINKISQYIGDTLS